MFVGGRVLLCKPSEGTEGGCPMKDDEQHGLLACMSIDMQECICCAARSQLFLFLYADVGSLRGCCAFCDGWFWNKVLLAMELPDVSTARRGLRMQ